MDADDPFCPACGTAQEKPQAATDEVQQRHFRCKNCGAEVATDPEQRSYVCAFCDSTYVIEFSADESSRQPPEFIIGFAVDQDQAEAKFHAWLRSNRWFRPQDLHSSRIVEKLRGVYLPFWSFSMLAESAWSSSIGEHWYRTETYTTRENGKTVTKTRRVQETEWWDLRGRHHRYYSGFLVSGSKGLTQAEAETVKPFQLAALKRYQPFYLAGWLSEEYSVSRENALQKCQQEFYGREQQNVGNFLPGDTYRNLRVGTEFADVNSDLILLPVYLLSYRYGDKVYRFMINGQSGRAVGQKPLSVARISAAVASGLGLMAIMIFLFWWLSS